MTPLFIILIIMTAVLITATILLFRGGLRRSRWDALARVPPSSQRQVPIPPPSPRPLSSFLLHSSIPAGSRSQLFTTYIRNSAEVLGVGNGPASLSTLFPAPSQSDIESQQNHGDVYGVRSDSEITANPRHIANNPSFGEDEVTQSVTPES